MSNRIIELFSDLCLPFDGPDSPKAQAIKESIGKKIGQPRYLKETGLYVGPDPKELKVLLVSHMDLIPKFNKQFKKEEKRIHIENGKLWGPLDNTVTNAVAILVARDLIPEKKGLGVLFTEREEIDLGGMTKWMKKFHHDGIFYVNLDVTNDGWGKCCSIEYDEPNFAFSKRLCAPQSAFTTERICDDLDAVLEFGGCGLSACLPTKKTIHSFKNWTKVEILEPYFEEVKRIVCLALDHENFKFDTGFNSFKTIFKCAKVEDLPVQSPRQVGPWLGYGPNEEPDLSDLKTDGRPVDKDRFSFSSDRYRFDQFIEDCLSIPYLVDHEYFYMVFEEIDLSQANLIPLQDFAPAFETRMFDKAIEMMGKAAEDWGIGEVSDEEWFLLYEIRGM